MRAGRLEWHMAIDILAPDVFLKGDFPLVVLRDDGPPLVLYRLSDAEFEEQRQDTPGSTVTLTTDKFSIPATDTARPPRQDP